MKLMESPAYRIPEKSRIDYSANPKSLDAVTPFQKQI